MNFIVALRRGIIALPLVSEVPSRAVHCATIAFCLYSPLSGSFDPTASLIAMNSN
jgi:hypothetical protein